jgi:hypothetical protein
MSITPREIESLRVEQLKFMPSTATCKRKSWVGGEEVSIPETVWRDSICRFTPGFGVWRQVADQFVGITAFTFTAPYGTDLRAGDQIIDSESRSYEVRDVLAPKDYDTNVRALLDLVRD